MRERESMLPKKRKFTASDYENFGATDDGGGGAERRDGDGAVFVSSSWFVRARFLLPFLWRPPRRNQAQPAQVVKVKAERSTHMKLYPGSRPGRGNGDGALGSLECFLSS